VTMKSSLLSCNIVQFGEAGSKYAACFCLAYSSAWKMEALCSPETPDTLQTTQHCKPKDSTLHPKLKCSLNMSDSVPSTLY
jgi:organic hydroperoxide reductase OsmC/OhrA